MRLSRMSMKHCPEIAELYITPRNLGFYECNGVEAVALGARVVQDTGQAGALIIGGATVTLWPALLLWVVRVCRLGRWISGTLSETLHSQTIITHWRCTRFCAA